MRSNTKIGFENETKIEYEIRILLDQDVSANQERSTIRILNERNRHQNKNGIRIEKGTVIINLIFRWDNIQNEVIYSIFTWAELQAKIPVAGHTRFYSTKMSKCMRIAFVLLYSFFFKECYAYCNKPDVKNSTKCIFGIECQGDIKNVNVTLKCDYSDKPNSVHLILRDASERFDEPLKDTHFLKSVTKLQAVGNWKSAALSILQHTPVLKNLCLSGNNINPMLGRPFKKLRKLIRLDLSNNGLINIEGLFKFENKCSKLKILLLFNNKILYLTKHTFEELYSLVVLDMSHNSLGNLSPGIFRNLKKLIVLNMNHNNIRILGDALNHLVNLRHLHLKGNEIKYIDDGLKNVIQNLRTFDVSHNDIDNLPTLTLQRNREAQNYNGTCKVILSNNNIRFLSNATHSGQVVHSKNILIDYKTNFSMELDLSDNDIDEIAHRAFKGTSGIVSLDLSFNQLYKFVIKSQDLSDIVRLNLSNNYLNNLLYETFSSMENLEILDISNNILEVIEKNTFVSNRRLKYVNMENNRITSLDEYQIQMFHPEGGTLILSKNDISKIFFRVGEAHSLSTLSLNSNKINDMCNVKLYFLMDLRKLDLSNNGIEILTENCQLLPFGLIILDLSQNKIHTIHPSAFLGLSQLHMLRLSQNKLEKLYFGTFKGLNNLVTLDLSYNKISFLDSTSFFDLKSLTVLLVRYNQIEKIDESYWMGHDRTLSVYVDGNNLTCEWVSRAVDDFENGVSNMKPTVFYNYTSANNSIKNIPCTSEDGRVKKQSVQTALADERLLTTKRKILKEIVRRNGYVKTVINAIIKKEKKGNETI